MGTVTMSREDGSDGLAPVLRLEGTGTVPGDTEII